MSDLFSHAQPVPAESQALPPLTLAVRVGRSVEETFQGFTGYPYLWWPQAEHSVFADDAHVEFEDNALVETSAAGQDRIWAHVLGWEPPAFFSLRWLSDPAGTASTQVDVHFEATTNNAGTEVTVTHSGWERLADPAAARKNYAAMWNGALERFVRFMGAEGL